MRASLAVGLTLAMTFVGTCCVEAQSSAQVDFNFDVKPLLSDRCFKCHGPDAEHREADLRLDTKDGAYGLSAEDTPILKPGDASASELFRRITSTDPDVQMPPPDSNLKLSQDEIDLIGRWIKQGANWKQHWSFLPLERIPVARTKNTTWAKNEIDQFVLAGLEEAGIEPAPEASKEKWLRRVTFDLIGLPPTLEEIDAFLADESPQAYERVVDRLLASERFGERMAADWLDVARYSDTYGYQVDRDRFVWPWRDWVIRAFNSNMPYDDFITQQLAGDLLPDATDDQILATTFNRLHPQKVEGGSVPEEFRVEYVADRTQTMGTAVLGLTLECCRCHDHKYDPISTKEYYQFFAFFDKIDEAGLYSYFTPSVPTPTLRLTNDAAKKNIAAIEAQISAAEAALSKLTTSREEDFQKWLTEGRPKLVENRDAVKIDSLVPGQIQHLHFEDHKGGANASVEGKVGKAVRLSGDDGIGLKVGNFRRFDPFSISLWLQTPDVKERAVVFHRSRAWTDAGSRGYELLLEDGHLSFALIHFDPGNSIRVRSAEPLSVGNWQHLTMTYDGSSRASGIQLFLNGVPAKQTIVRDTLYKNITGGGGDNITIGERFRDRGFSGGLVDEFRVFSRQLSSLEASQLHDGEALASRLAEPVAELGPDELQKLREYYLSTVDPAAADARKLLREKREALSKAVDGLQEIMVMLDLNSPKRQTFLLGRGLYTNRKEAVGPETPQVFPKFPNEGPRNRLGLARWLTDPQNPLTARVAVNRLWQMAFGEGLVRTPEDFGSQGTLPTHPQLLDWLAGAFIAEGWDVKRTLKQMVLSATYRQSSASGNTDPQNLRLARSSAYRLPAEMLRDNALAVSGLLRNKIGGPPAKPYEVAVSFKPVGRDKGEGLYRRSVYTYWKRTGPAPVMRTLDAAKRDVCEVKRERTSSPLQALVMMNGPQFVEAARALAQRLIQKHGENDEASIVDMFRLLTSRRPDETEMSVLREFFETTHQEFVENPNQAQELLKVGDLAVDTKLPPAKLAALAVVANTLFSFDECVMKR
ncbi:MAG: DUF1553 domain-containing protein [Planctomycetota bacterium]|nr:DUF1553 domain-containing protein [Planctomycetota bacterium]MDA1250696.1 DUF1553 domain-containing protein [Planctomycetota bacterium]